MYNVHKWTFWKKHDDKKNKNSFEYENILIKLKYWYEFMKWIHNTK